ncbi:peroxisomal acyl-coenzyme A oxidase 1-like isoform X2 [Anneissia japonica]|uniref:peroxisomal acyl-coenzyme A oxidase 1-like isoform X2 n=1 Tax=Anneissia japonica TaxID=1529436 RepID=UPI001425B83A|nr:peroxisomal acyl-coenzyme A oxidase 1-like isoform X2 [Anneissia japonica]
MSMMPSSVSATKVNPDIQNERNKATFDPIHITYLIDEGKEKTKRRRYIESLVENDPDFQNKPLAFMTREERYTNSIRKALLAVRKMEKLGLTDPWEKQIFTSVATVSEVTNIGLHSSMFTTTVTSQMNDEQISKWLPLCMNIQLIGTYAQTELGHGTYLRGLETTATFDPDTDEFELHSPTLTSIKWWPGNLGKTVTHAVVAAQLYTQGKCYGVHMFMVPLRSLENHVPLPGIEIGDIGPKFGYSNIDNGFLRFNKYRIPRENMFMKYSKVERNGTYLSPPRAKLTYGSMVLIRSFIVGSMGTTLAKGATISIRYSSVRRQSELEKGAQEPQVLDFQSQQLKLLPYLAMAYAFIFAGKKMKDMYIQSSDSISKGDFSVMPELHATSAGLKAYTSSICSEGLEIQRMSCGGHGYSHASGFPELYANSTPACTYEGENTVMMLQTARFLMKCMEKANNGEKLHGACSYMCEKLPRRSQAFHLEDFLNSELLIQAYKHRAHRMCMVASQAVQEQVRMGKPQHEAWNKSHFHLLKASEAHCHLYIVDHFYEYVLESSVPAPVKDVLLTLCHLHALHGISTRKGEFLHDGYFSGHQIDLVEKQVIQLLDKVRPNSVALVDAFDFSDRVLDSVLGRYDGNVYENLYKWAKSCPMNEKEVPDAYGKYIRPFLMENRSKL